VGRLNPQQLKELGDELATLMKQQSDARMTAVVFPHDPGRH
jgi:hypothetical protein